MAWNELIENKFITRHVQLIITKVIAIEILFHSTEYIPKFLSKNKQLFTDVLQNRWKGHKAYNFIKKVFFL